jgi:mycothiol synthase
MGSIQEPERMTDTESELALILELALAQRPDPQGWSLVADTDWLRRSYFGSGFARRLDALPSRHLSASTSIGPAGAREGLTITSMLRPGREHGWPEQLAWIEERVEAASASRVQVISECLTGAEASRWMAAGYELVFEELAMQRVLDGDVAPARWPEGMTIVEWGDAAATASFDAYEAAFRDRPGFPRWSRSEWIDRLTGDDAFLPDLSMCVLWAGTPAGFVVCSNGWVDQVGVAPAHRRRGLATALVTEATNRMRALGIGVARLHVNVNNPVAMAAWQRLGWRECGRRGRFERRAPSSGAMR